MTEKELCSTVAPYTSGAAGHVQESKASILATFSARNEVLVE